MDYRKLELEELDKNDYKVLISSLIISKLYMLEFEESYYNELLSKIERNLDKLCYNKMIEDEGE